MSDKIIIQAPLYRYGNRVVNLNFVKKIDLRTGDIFIAGGDRFKVPPKVAAAWVSGVVDYKAFEGQLTGGVQ